MIRRPNPQVGLVIGLVILAAVLKFPIFILLAIVFTIIYAAKVSIPNKPAKKALPKGPVKVVKIDGVGAIEWVTDERQLEAGGAWNLQTLRYWEEQLLRRGPQDWREEGESVAIAEEERANKTPTPSGMHQGGCRCADCVGVMQAALERSRPRKSPHGHKNAFEPACHDCFMGQRKLNSVLGKGPVVEELTVDDQVVAVARSGLATPPNKSYNEVSPYYSKGGVVLGPGEFVMPWRQRRGITVPGRRYVENGVVKFRPYNTAVSRYGKL